MRRERQTNVGNGDMITEAQVDAALRAYFKIGPRERLDWLTPKLVTDMRTALEAAEKAPSSDGEEHRPLPHQTNLAA
jgi:hypothetical protein